MKRKQKTAPPLWSLLSGEIRYHDLHNGDSLKNKPDTPFDRPIVPYLVLFFCAAVDGAVFFSLFSAISYDRPLMLVIQVAGFLFGFDVIPIYIGIHLRRLRQRLSADWFILWLALAACIVVCGMNTFLRIATISQLMPVRFSFLGGSASVSSADASTAEALTVFGIGIPLVTSIGSFFISYLTYNPLLVRKRREEYLLAEKRDEIRRLEAALADFDAETEYAQWLLKMDLGHFEETRRLCRAYVLRYCSYVRHRLSESLPESTAQLDPESCHQLLQRLDDEIACLKGAPRESAESGITDFPTAKNAPLRRMTR